MFRGVIAIVRDGNEWFVQDLGSHGGTVVNGNRISSRTAIKSGDQVRVGPVILAISIPSEATRKLAGVEIPVGSVFFQGKPTGLVPLGSNLVLGRGDDVDVFLSDPLVSPRHAMVEAHSGRWRLIDLQKCRGIVC